MSAIIIAIRSFLIDTLAYGLDRLQGKKREVLHESQLTRFDNPVLIVKYTPYVERGLTGADVDLITLTEDELEFRRVELIRIAKGIEQYSSPVFAVPTQNLIDEVYMELRRRRDEW